MSNIINLVKLSYSNLNSVKKMLLFSIFVFVAISVINPAFLNMLVGIIVFQVTYQLMAFEDISGIDYLISYIPVSRKEYIISKYIVSIVNTLLAVGVFTICYYLATKYSPYTGQLLDYQFTLSMATTAATIGIAIIIPCILKLGNVKGRMISTFLMLLTVMLPGMGMVLFEDSEFLGSIISNIDKVSMPMIFIIVNIVIVVISYLVSLKIYSKKEIL